MIKILIIMMSMFSFLGSKSDSIRKVNASVFSQEIKVENVQLVDVRTAGEYSMGHIEGALLIDFYSNEFKSKISELNMEDPVYIYCRSGNRSGSAASVMEGLGFTDIIDLEGGYMSWVNK